MWRQKATMAGSVSDPGWPMRTAVVPVPREPRTAPPLSTQQPSTQQMSAYQPSPPSPSPTSAGWRIRDRSGQIVVSGLRSRSLAIRMLGTYVGDHDLPLRVEDANGQPTGDRLG